MAAASSLETPSLTELGRAVDQVLGLLEAQAGHLADDLDHVDLLVARAREDDRELGLLLGRAAAAAAPPAPAAAIITGAAAAAETPHFSSSIFTSSRHLHDGERAQVVSRSPECQPLRSSLDRCSI